MKILYLSPASARSSCSFHMIFFRWLKVRLSLKIYDLSSIFQSWDTTSISLTAGCDLFMRYVTRTSALEFEDFNAAKARVLGRAEKFGEISYKVSGFL